MKKLNENLSEIFDVEPINLEEKETTTTEVVVSGTNSVVELDTDFARINIKSLIKKGNVAIDDLLQVAKHSEHPRAYEVAATLIKNLPPIASARNLPSRAKGMAPASVLKVPGTRPATTSCKAGTAPR